jgi:hypothetical protein
LGTAWEISIILKLNRRTIEFHQKKRRRKTTPPTPLTRPPSQSATDCSERRYHPPSLTPRFNEWIASATRRSATSKASHLETNSISALTNIHASLRAALEHATDYGNARILNQIATALGSVRIEMDRSAAQAGGDDQGASPDSPAGDPNHSIAAESELGELIVAALTLAETLGQDHTALILNDALINVTGEGISPKGWPPA